MLRVASSSPASASRGWRARHRDELDGERRRRLVEQVPAVEERELVRRPRGGLERADDAVLPAGDVGHGRPYGTLRRLGR